MPREVREQQMLDAASALFAHREYSRVSMDEIAERVGVTKPMLYSYFGSKEGLFAACVVEVNKRLRDYLRERTAPVGDPELRLWTGIRSLFAWMDQNRDAWPLVRNAVGAGVTELMAEVERGQREMVQTIGALFKESAFAAGIGTNLAAEIEVMAEAFVAACAAIARRWILEHPEETADHQALRAMNFVWIGLGAMATEQRLWIPPPDA